MHPARAVVRRGLAYQEGIALQRECLAHMAADATCPATVLFAEHRPVITYGRSGDLSNLLVQESELALQGIALRETNRGGDVTYHGPGQWTVYPVLRLEWYGRDLHRYLRMLEQCVIHFLEAYGVKGGRRAGLTGVWVGEKKIAAVGVAVSRWIAWHGFAVNITTNPENFTRFMHPCGIRAEEGGVTNLETATGKRYEIEDVLEALGKAVAGTFDLEFLE